MSSQSPLFEETYHAFQFSKGGFGYPAVIGTKESFALDLEDEAWAKLFAAQNTTAQKYKYEKDILKSYNVNGIDGVKDCILSKTHAYDNLQYNSLNVVDYCNQDPNISIYAPNYFDPNGQSIFTQIIMEKP